MVSIKEQITNIINGVNICALCLKEVADGEVNIRDEIVLDNSKNVTMLEIINLVMGYELQENAVSKFLNSVCLECTNRALKCYTFMTMCHSTHKEFNKLIDRLSNLDFDSLLLDTGSDKSIYLAVVNEDLDMNIVIDKNMRPKTRRSAFKRYRSLINQIKKSKIDRILTPIEEIPDYYNEFVEIRETNIKSYSCNYCSRVFKQKNLLKKHYDRIHAEKRFSCSKCPKKFGREYLKNLHISETHITAICAECGKIYKNLHSLKTHMRSHQTMICNICGKHYKNKHRYADHLKICGTPKIVSEIKSLKSPPERKFQCDVCQKGFVSINTLRIHIKFEHENGKAYICSWCNKKFPAKSYLQNHIVKHTRERNFTCEICGGKFVTKEALRYHIRIHTGEKPYPCPECEEWFLSTSRRMEHLRRKHWAPSWECDICASKFRSSFSLKKHRARHFNPNSKLFAQKSFDEAEVK